jgi:hypothetical protein
LHGIGRVDGEPGLGSGLLIRMTDFPFMSDMKSQGRGYCSASVAYISGLRFMSPVHRAVASEVSHACYNGTFRYGGRRTW